MSNPAEAYEANFIPPQFGPIAEYLVNARAPAT